MDSFKSKPAKMEDLVVFLSVITAANAHMPGDARHPPPQQHAAQRLEQEVPVSETADGAQSPMSGYLGEISEGDLSDAALGAVSDSDVCLDWDSQCQGGSWS